jgi:hypothetical protein
MAMQASFSPLHRLRHWVNPLPGFSTILPEPPQWARAAAILLSVALIIVKKFANYKDLSRALLQRIGNALRQKPARRFFQRARTPCKKLFAAFAAPLRLLSVSRAPCFGQRSRIAPRAYPLFTQDGGAAFRTPRL